MTEKDYMYRTVLRDDEIFRGDKDGAERILRDEIRVAMKDYQSSCVWCGGNIVKGSLHRYSVMIWQGFTSGRICKACCAGVLLEVEGVDEGNLKYERMNCKRSMR